MYKNKESIILINLLMVDLERLELSAIHAPFVGLHFSSPNRPTYQFYLFIVTLNILLI